MGKRSERLERWGPDYQGPVCYGKEVDFTLGRFQYLAGMKLGGKRVRLVFRKKLL